MNPHIAVQHTSEGCELRASGPQEFCHDVIRRILREDRSASVAVLSNANLQYRCVGPHILVRDLAKGG